MAQIIKWFIALVFTLFALATFMGHNYAQTIVIIAIVIILFYWPDFINKQLGRLFSVILRIIVIITIFSLNITVLSSGTKNTIYSSAVNKQKLIETYNNKLKDWPADTKDIYINTEYGNVHILTCGSPENPPLVLLHAASMGAHSWAENLSPLIEKYCIYAIDNIGEGNKSTLNDATFFPASGKDLADLYSLLFDSLKIQCATVFGASNGGFIAQVLAFYHPEKVESLLLFGPMGLTQLSKGSIFMMSVGSMYPFKFIRKAVTHWAIGHDNYCNQKYGDWFDIIIQGTIPSIAQPVPMTKFQKEKIKIPVVLFLGSNDPIVGNAELAKKAAMDYPDVRVEILESGHLIAVEKRNYINDKLYEILK